MSDHAELLALLAGPDPEGDAACRAADYLESLDGGDYPDSYTYESLIEAVEQGDPLLLRRC